MYAIRSYYGHKRIIFDFSSTGAIDSAGIGALAICRKRGFPAIVFVALRRIFLSSDGETGVGFAAYFPVIDGDTDLIHFSFRDYGNSEQVFFNVNVDGAIEAWRAAGGIGQQPVLLGKTADGMVLPLTWVYLELRVWAHDSTGTIEVRVNGFTQLYLDGQDTRAGAYDGCGQFSIIVTYLPSSTGNQVYVTDFVGFVEGSDEPAAGFFGAKYIKDLTVSADGTPSQWGLYGAATAAEAVDDAVPDGDTSYIYSLTPGNESRFVLTNTYGEEHGQILGTQVYSVQRKTQTGHMRTRLDIAVGATVAQGVDRPTTENRNNFV